jgi:acylphosphatase
VTEAFEKIVRLRVVGDVQGVGYRAWTIREAKARQLQGWVRNLASGDVEAVLAGSAPAVDAMIEACRNGPRYAVVASVDVEIADRSALNGSGFRQLASA